VDRATAKVTALPPLTALGHGLGLPAMTMAGDRLFTFTGAWLNPATKEVGNIAEAFTYDFAAKSWRVAVSV
jgi:hypothetical protein